MTIREDIAHFLQTEILINKFVYIDIWSILHFFSGFFLVIPIYYMTKRSFKALYWLAGILTLWELFEIIMWLVVQSIFFDPESAIDVLWDIFIGMVGGTIMILILKLKK